MMEKNANQQNLLGSNYILNGICNDCEIGYDKISRESESEGVTCTFKPCSDGDTELEYCPNCEDGYYTDFVNDGKCKPYTTEDNSKINEVRYRWKTFYYD